MNICFYSPVWPPGSPPNGIATYVHHMKEGLCGQEHASFILSSVTSEDTAQDASVINVENYSSRLHYYYSQLLNRMQKRRGTFIFQSGKIKRALLAMNARYNLDVLEMEESFGWSFAFSDIPAVLPVTRLHGPHFLMVDWKNKDSISEEDHWRIQCEGEAIRAAPLITSPSQKVLEQTREFYNLELNHAEVIPNPICMPPAENRWSFEDCEQNTLLFVGRFDRIKGADILLQAFEQLVNRYPELKLLFVGPDYGIRQADGGVLTIQSFMESTLSSQTKANITYLGYQSPSQIAKLRCQAFASVVCSRYETFGYNLLEAMSFGSPVVTTTQGGLGEIAKDGYNAVAVDEVESTALAAGIESLLNNAELAKQLSQNALDDCERYYCRSEIAKNTVAAYKSMV